jgi:hypothetical protein
MSCTDSVVKISEIVALMIISITVNGLPSCFVFICEIIT